MSIYIAFGSNQALGSIQPDALPGEAARALEEAGISLIARSSLWRSPAWPDPSDPPYTNAVARIETLMAPERLLACLHDVEARFSRVRKVLNAPRTLDLDIIDYRGGVADGTAGPVLPHPRAHQRAFVLLPLREIAPDWTHPLTGEGIERLIAALPPEDVAATRRAGAFTLPG